MKEYEVKFLTRQPYARAKTAHTTTVLANDFVGAVKKTLELNIDDDDIVSVTDLS